MIVAGSLPSAIKKAYVLNVAQRKTMKNGTMTLVITKCENGYFVTQSWDMCGYYDPRKFWVFTDQVQFTEWVSNHLNDEKPESGEASAPSKDQQNEQERKGKAPKAQKDEGEASHPGGSSKHKA